MSAPSLFDGLDDTLCRYGTPQVGSLPADRPCSRPATHVAHWAKNDEAGSIACCRDHANYYATAWCPIYPAEPTVAWIEILSAVEGHRRTDAPRDVRR